MSDRQKIGDRIDGLGVTTDLLNDDDIVSEVIVLMKVVNGRGEVRLMQAHSSMSWIERSGMLRVAEQIDMRELWQQRRDDDE